MSSGDDVALNVSAVVGVGLGIRVSMRVGIDGSLNVGFGFSNGISVGVSTGTGGRLGVQLVSSGPSGASLIEVVLLLPGLGSSGSVAWGVDDGFASTLDAGLGGVIGRVDSAADSLGTAQHLATEPLGVSDDAIGVGLAMIHRLKLLLGEGESLRLGVDS